MKSLGLAIFFLLMSCFSDPQIDGAWKLSINLQDKELPVLITLTSIEGNKLSGELINGDEKLPLEGNLLKGNKFELNIAAHYAKLVGTFEGNSISGQWIRTNKEDFEIDFIGARTSRESLFKEYESEKTPLSINGKWKIKLSKEKFGLGLFKQTGTRVQGSVLTSTGDYRYLDGYIKENQVYLYGFDGVFSFIFEGVLEKDQFVANMYSGKSSHTKIKGVLDETFQLDDPLSLTEKLNDKPVKLKMQNIDGELVDLDKGKFKNKAKVIQVFGSWCPNCHDESHFFVKWRKLNQEKLSEVKFIAVSFERSTSKEAALKDLNKVRTKLGMDYDIVMADFDNTVKVTDVLPLKNSVAFPTTIYVGRDNKIKKIHTGFSGQATGEFFEAFTKDFDQTIDTLL